MRTSSSASSLIGTVDSPDYQNPGPPFGTVAITGGPRPSPADRRSTGRIPASWVPPGLPPGVGPQQARPEAHQMERPAGRPLLWPCLCLWVTLLHHDRLTGQSPVQCLLCTFSNLELEPSPCRCQPCQARVKFRLPSAPSRSASPRLASQWLRTLWPLHRRRRPTHSSPPACSTPVASLLRAISLHP